MSKKNEEFDELLDDTDYYNEISDCFRDIDKIIDNLIDEHNSKIN